jgi:hypothetical protein
MKMRLYSSTKIVYCLVFLLIFSSVFFWQPKAESSNQAEKPFDLSNYDIRLDESSSAREAIAGFIGQAGKSTAKIVSDRKIVLAAEEKLRRQKENLKIEYNEDLRIPEVISPDFATRKLNFLTAPTDEKRAYILENFINQNAEIFGLSRTQISELEKTADYTNPDGNLSFVHFEQKINSIPVFRGEIKAGFTRKNEIVRIINNLAPRLDYKTISKDFGNAERAVENAAKHINFEANETDTKRIEAAPNDLKVTFERGQFSDKTTAEKLYFPIDYGTARAAWRVLIWTQNEAFYVIVDAETGTLLWRKNITESQTQTATYNIYGNGSLMRTAESAAPIPFSTFCTGPQNCPQPGLQSRNSFTLVGNQPPYQFNQLGWIPDGENRTIGNNAEAGIDRIAPNGIDDNGWAFGSPNRNFVYSYNPAPGDEEPLPATQTYPPSPFQQGSITHAFYATNRFHDEMYRLGFNETARNFQANNFGLGGLGDDSISVETQDGSGTNGSSFSTTADGGRPRLQLFIWATPTPDRDGALDSQVIVHELTHGVSNRLHGNASGLNTNMARGMGEGWSDFYALALLSENLGFTDRPISIACYSTAGITNCYYGLRRFPITRKTGIGANGLPHNPLTFGYLNAGCDTLIGTTTTNPNSAFPRNPALATSGNCDQVHNMGEVWSAALWEVRGQLTDRHDSLFNSVNGNLRALRYVTDGMKLSPLNPTILQSRDTILAAMQVSDPTDLCLVWRGFAARGMGVSASIQNIGTGANNTVVTEAFDVPLQCRRPKRADFDGDGKSDISVYRPSEGNWYLNRSTAGFTAINWGISTDRLVPADYDGDGKTDFAVFRATADSNQPDFYILNSSSFTVSGYSWGIPGDVPVVEDYDGDNKDDIAVFRNSTRVLYIIKSSGGNTTFSDEHFSGTPTTGDFDGDGFADFANLNSNGWIVIYSTYNYASGLVYGIGTTEGDKPVPADYDGDGIDDLAAFRPSNGTWTIRKSSGGIITVPFGISTDVPAPADYDGDGRADIAVYRNGTWWINRSTDGVLTTQFGLSGDIPIANGYLP